MHGAIWENVCCFVIYVPYFAEYDEWDMELKIYVHMNTWNYYKCLYMGNCIQI